MTFIEPLALENIVLNIVIGNAVIFTFIAFVTIAALAARFRMPNSLFMLFLAIFGVMFAGYIGGIYIIIILLTSFVTFEGFNKVFNA